ncbi:hypothetical protein QBC35DRAFT_391761, partial [Podospora australis]
MKQRPPSSEREGDFSCPFRKKNPIRFNIRDHVACASKGFRTIGMVKYHVKNHHLLPHPHFTCSRCQTVVVTKEKLDSHERVKQICDVNPLAGQHRSDNPENGITPSQEAILSSRKHDSRVDTWEALWNSTLFPDESHVPHHSK